jgi:hypothetical protein
MGLNQLFHIRYLDFVGNDWRVYTCGQPLALVQPDLNEDPACGRRKPTAHQTMAREAGWPVEIRLTSDGARDAPTTGQTDEKGDKIFWGVIRPATSSCGAIRTDQTGASSAGTCLTSGKNNSSGEVLRGDPVSAAYDRPCSHQRQ